MRVPDRTGNANPKNMFICALFRLYYVWLNRSWGYFVPGGVCPFLASGGGDDNLMIAGGKNRWIEQVM
jgi:hypothetical protein